MSKKNLLYIDQDKFHAAIAKLHAEGVPLQTEDKAGYTKVFALQGRNGARVYVPKGKRVSRIDLSCFTIEFGARDLGGESWGNVKQLLDFSTELTEAEVLANFEQMLRHMATIPPAPPKPVVEKKAKSASSPDKERDARKTALIAAANKDRAPIEIPDSELPASLQDGELTDVEGEFGDLSEE